MGGPLTHLSVLPDRINRLAEEAAFLESFCRGLSVGDEMEEQEFLQGLQGVPRVDEGSSTLSPLYPTRLPLSQDHTHMSPRWGGCASRRTPGGPGELLLLLPPPSDWASLASSPAP